MGIPTKCPNCNESLPDHNSLYNHLIENHNMTVADSKEMVTREIMINKEKALKKIKKKRFWE